MSTVRLSLILLSGLSLAGCRANQTEALLERELRHQENKIYALQDELAECAKALDAAHRENEALKKEIATGDAGPGELVEPDVELPRGITEPSRPLRRRDEPALDAPRVEPGIESPAVEPDIELPPAEPGSVPPVDPDEPPPPFRPSSSVQGAAARRSLPGKPSPAPRGKPTKLVFNTQLTGGWNADHRFGHEGVMAVIEPRDATGQVVAAQGDVSIVVLDRIARTRVARWDFSADEAPEYFRKTPLGHGYHFELPWPSKPPANAELQLFVRLTNPDGTRLQADMPIRVQTLDREARWAPATTARRETSAKDSAEQPAEDRRASEEPRRLRSVKTDSPRTAARDKPAPAEQTPPPVRQAMQPERPVWKPFR